MSLVYESSNDNTEIGGFTYLPQLCNYSVKTLMYAYSVDTLCRARGSDVADFVYENKSKMKTDELECCNLVDEFVIPGEILLVCAALKISNLDDYNYVETQTNKLYEVNTLRMAEFSWAFSSGVTQILDVDIENCIPFWELVAPHIMWKGLRIISPSCELLFNCPEGALDGFEEEFIYPFKTICVYNDCNDVYTQILGKLYYEFKYPERVVSDTDYFYTSSVRALKVNVFLNVWEIVYEMGLSDEDVMRIMNTFINVGVNWIAVKNRLKTRTILNQCAFEELYHSHLN